MADRDLNIILKLRDGLSAKLNKVSEDMGKFERGLQKTAQSMNRVGTSMAFLGGALTGSFGLALNNAAKYNLQARDTVEHFQTALTHLQVTITTAVLPTFERMAVVIGNLVQWFQSLDPSIRDTALNVALLTGIFLTLGGVVLKVGSAILKILGVLVAHPFVAAMTVGIGLVIFHWKEWEEQIKKTINAFEIGAYMVGIGFQKISKWISDSLVVLTQQLGDYFRALGKIIGPQQDLFLKAADSMDQMAGKIRKSSTDAEATIKSMEAAIADVMANGNVHTDAFVSKVGELVEKLKTLGSGEFSLEPLVQKFDALRTLAQGTATAMTAAFSDIFFKAFTGDLSNIKETFRDFGRQILSMISQVLAKLLLIKMFGNIGIGGIKLGGLFHQGGIVKAHNGMSLANDEVPIIAQKGEGVISRRGMQALGSDNFSRINRGEGAGGSRVSISTPVIIQLMSAEDVHRHKKTISSVVGEAIKNNEGIRDIMRRYR